MRCGIGAPELLNVESEIRANTNRYAAVLQTTHGARYNPEEHSATERLEYFAEICVDRLELRNRLTAAVQGDVGLLFMELDRSSVRAMLAAMAAEGWLEPAGERRGRRYGPGHRLLDLPLRTPELMDRFRVQ